MKTSSRMLAACIRLAHGEAVDLHQEINCFNDAEQLIEDLLAGLYFLKQDSKNASEQQIFRLMGRCVVASTRLPMQTDWKEEDFLGTNCHQSLVKGSFQDYLVNFYDMIQASFGDFTLEDLMLGTVLCSKGIVDRTFHATLARILQNESLQKSVELDEKKLSQTRKLCWYSLAQRLPIESVLRCKVLVLAASVFIAYNDSIDDLDIANNLISEARKVGLIKNSYFWARSLLEQGRASFSMGELKEVGKHHFESAVVCFMRSRKEGLVEGTNEWASSLFLEGICYYQIARLNINQKVNFKCAVDMYRRCRVEGFKKGEPEWALSLLNEGNAKIGFGDLEVDPVAHYEHAVFLYERSRAEGLERGSEAWASSLVNEGNAYQRMAMSSKDAQANYKDSIVCYERSREEGLVSGSVSWATSLAMEANAHGSLACLTQNLEPHLEIAVSLHRRSRSEGLLPGTRGWFASLSNESYLVKSFGVPVLSDENLIQEYEMIIDELSYAPEVAHFSIHLADLIPNPKQKVRVLQRAYEALKGYTLSNSLAEDESFAIERGTGIVEKYLESLLMDGSIEKFVQVSRDSKGVGLTKFYRRLNLGIRQQERVFFWTSSGLQEIEEEANAVAAAVRLGEPHSFQRSSLPESIFELVEGADSSESLAAGFPELASVSEEMLSANLHSLMRPGDTLVEMQLLPDTSVSYQDSRRECSNQLAWFQTELTTGQRSVLTCRSFDERALKNATEAWNDCVRISSTAHGLMMTLAAGATISASEWRALSEFFDREGHHDLTVIFSTGWERVLSLDPTARVAEAAGLYGEAVKVIGDKASDVLAELGGLLQPAFGCIERGASIIISPSGYLNQIPFGALRMKDENGEEYHLIDRHPIAILPTANLAPELVTALNGATGDNVVVVEQFNADALAVRGYRQEISDRLGRTPKVLYRNDSTAEKLIEEAIDAAILQFFCHGMFDGSEPTKSGLYLSDGNGDQQLFTFRDIVARLRLPKTKLVFMCACESSRTSGRGDEMLGIAGAFLRIGSPSVIGTLWEVYASVAAKFSLDLYQEWNNGGTLISSFQKATIEAKNRDQNPLSWAPFQLYGAWNTLYTKK